jgi:D-ribose pyranose/furanose isomerase RbsD
VTGIDFGKGGIDPLFGFEQLDLGISDGVEVLLERLAVVARKLPVERVDVGDEEVERALAAGKLVAGFPSLGGGF